MKKVIKNFQRKINFIHFNVLLHFASCPLHRVLPDRIYS